MQAELIKTEKGYRALKLDSSSSLKDFSLDKRKYHKRYVLDEPVKEKTTVAIITGQVVETLLLEPDLFDEKFYMSACVSEPTGLMLAFVEALYREAKEATNSEGIVDASFEFMSENAYKASGYKLKYEAVIKKFSETDAVVYFEEICNVRSKGLIVVTAQDVNNAEKIVEELQNNSITKKLVTLQTNGRYTVLDQHKAHGYVIDGHNLKSMMDRVIIDHADQTIQVLDLKCTWTVENFYREYYLHRRSYIQAYLYFKACEAMRDADPALAGYTVEFPIFVVCDSINYYSPLIYTLSQVDIDDAYNGFVVNNRLYPGVKEIIENLQWALENDIWNITRVAYQAGGVINIRHGA